MRCCSRRISPPLDRTAFPQVVNFAEEPAVLPSRAGAMAGLGTAKLFGAEALAAMVHKYAGGKGDWVLPGWTRTSRTMELILTAECIACSSLMNMAGAYAKSSRVPSAA